MTNPAKTGHSFLCEDEHFTRWPDVARLCFGPGEPRRLNADVHSVLSGDQHGMYGYVEGYRRAAAAVFDQAARTKTNPSFTILPLAFLWRHHLELALKEIIALGRLSQGEQWGFPEHHKLLDLWRDAQEHIAHVGSLDAPEVAHVEANLREFERVDPGSFGFRYPRERGTRDRTLTEAPSTLNLRVLHESMEAVANFLSAARMGLSVYLDFVTDPP